MKPTFVIAAFAATLLYASLAQADPPARPVTDRLPAIWQAHQIDFDFRSERIAFRCEEFAWRLERILDSIGARLDPGTQLLCSDSFSSTVKGRIVVVSPVEATEANVQRALAGISSVDQLAARLNGLPDPKSRIHVFPAEWRRVSSAKSKLDAADCDLLRAVARHVLPTLELRDLEISTACMSNRIPKFSAMALVRVDGVYVDGKEAQSQAGAAGAQCARGRTDDTCRPSAEDSSEGEAEFEATPAG